MSDSPIFVCYPAPDGHTHCIIDGAIVPEERDRFKATTCSEQCKKVRRQRRQKGDLSTLCVVCTRPIDEIRCRRGSITCSPEHGKIRKASLRGRFEQRYCRACCRTSSPIERAAFRRFRKMELMRPDLLYPAAFKAWQQDGGDLTSFATALEESFQNRSEDDDNPNRFDLGLIDRRSKDKPGGALSGRPPMRFEGGDPDCVHVLPTKPREGQKPRKGVDLNKCKKCGATKYGAPPPQPEESNAIVEV